MVAMNRVKIKLLGPQMASASSSSSSFSAAMFMANSSFHSTSVLEKKRKTHWHYRFNYYAKKKKNRGEPKRANLCDYAELLFQSWREEEERKPTGGPSWFRDHHWVRNSRNNGFNQYSSAKNYKINGAFNSSDDDEEEIETVFRSTFGAERFTYWSFGNSNFRNNTFRNNSYYHFRNSNKRSSYDSDDEDSGTKFGTKSEISSARETLGLNISGPLKLEEVKNAYRTCALRWHPDRHGGPSKVAAEEKFKHCSAAYNTLCDSLKL